MYINIYIYIYIWSHHYSITIHIIPHFFRSRRPLRLQRVSCTCTRHDAGGIVLRIHGTAEKGGPVGGLGFLWESVGLVLGIYGYFLWFIFIYVIGRYFLYDFMMFFWDNYYWDN